MPSKFFFSELRWFLKKKQIFLVSGKNYFHKPEWKQDKLFLEQGYSLAQYINFSRWGEMKDKSNVILLSNNFL